MNEIYVPGKSRKNIYRSCRRRQEGKTRVVIFGGIMLLAVVIAAGIIWKVGFAKDKTTNKTTDKITNVDNYLTLVNRQNPIPEDFEPELVRIQGGERVDERILGPLMSMLEDARKANGNQMPRVVSGYRTSDQQQTLYDEKIADYIREGYSEREAKELAEQWVAAPGCSEHQLGFAVDINGETYDVYSWLMENSYKYGFIFRYPGDKSQITGVEEEVWHYRYVGAEAAAEIYEQGVCLEEYLENMSAQSRKKSAVTP